MAIDISLRQHYQDGEKVDPFEKGRAIIAPKERYLPRDKKNLMDVFSDVMLRKKGLIAQDIKDVKAGKPISKVASNILKRQFAIGGEKASPIKTALQAGRTLNLGKNILGGTKGGLPSLASNVVSTIGKALPFAGIAGGAMLANKYREQITGYPTQVAYEEARQDRIDIDRVQMRLAPKTKENLKINWERQGFNDDEIREKERKYDEETAELLGATVIDDQIILGQDYFPDLGGDPEGQAEASPTVSDTAATEDININQAPVVTPLPVFQPPQRAPTPVHHWTPSGNGGGGQNGGGGGMGRGRDPGGGTPGSPFAHGGRIDKALKGRSRDI